MLTMLEEALLEDPTIDDAAPGYVGFLYEIKNMIQKLHNSLNASA